MSSPVVAVVSGLLSLLDEDAEPSSNSVMSTDSLFLPSVRSIGLAPSPCIAVEMESFSFLSGSCSFLLWMVKTDCSWSNLNRFSGGGGPFFFPFGPRPNSEKASLYHDAEERSSVDLFPWSSGLSDLCCFNLTAAAFHILQDRLFREV